MSLLCLNLQVYFLLYNIFSCWLAVSLSLYLALLVCLCLALTLLFLLLLFSHCWGQFFQTTGLHFIGDLHYVNTVMNFGKTSFKAQKSPYLHKKASKPMVQAHSTSSHFLAHDPSLWVSSGEFLESWFGGPRSMFSKARVVQSW